MKTRTLLLSLLLTGTALALLPSAQAAVIPGPVVCVTDPCPPYPVPTVNYCTLKQATPGPNPYYTPSLRELVWGDDQGCDIDVVGPSMDCAPPSSTGIDRTVGPVHVQAAACDGGIPDRLPDIAALTNAAPLDVDTRDYYACSPPSAIHVERHVGQHRVHVHVCDGGIPGLLPEVATAAPDWCATEDATPEPLRTQLWGTDAGCDIDVESNWSCAPPSGGYVERNVGPVHVKVLVCDGGIGDLIGPAA